VFCVLYFVFFVHLYVSLSHDSPVLLKLKTITALITCKSCRLVPKHMFYVRVANNQYALREVLTVVEVGLAGVDDGEAEQEPHPHPQHVLVVAVAVQQV
jgi:hypothetical protein